MISSPRALALVILPLALSVSEARAGEPAPELLQKAKMHVGIARHEYNLGKFDEAVRAYEAAYRLVPNPALLFNIGQCHRQAGRHEQALFFFEGYLREANPGPAQRKMVEDLQRESRKALREVAKKKAREAKKADKPKPKPAAKPAPAPAPRPAPKTQPPLPKAPTPPPPPTGVQASALTAQTTAPAEDSPGVHERWWFWTIVGVVVVAAGAGTAVALTRGGEGPLPEGSLGAVDWR